MNYRIAASALAGFLSLNLAAQTQTSVPANASYQIIDQGANHRVWQRVTTDTDATGRTVVQTNSYTELASGLNYWKDGQWAESKEEIEVYPGGAVARQGQHQVIFARNLATVGAIDMQTPDGKRLQSHVIGLSYFDVASGKSVLIAQVKDSVGEILPPNQVLYPDAFTDFKADVRYTYTKAGFEQDVILRERPPLPEDYGLDSKTTELQVLTEFLNPPQPQLQAREFQTKSSYAMSDTELSFGVMQMGRGKAFEVGDTGIPNRGNRIGVGKQWQTLDGRQFLVENVDIADIGPSLDQLPAATQASIQPQPGSVRHVVSTQRLLPELQWAKAGSQKAMEIAGLKPTGAALVLDYVTVNGSLTNYTFQGDTTYYVSGNLTLKGTTTIEGGAVIKFVTNAIYTLTVSGPLKCKTGPYRPAVFTSKNDNTIGETISGSTGAPSIESQDSYYLWIDNGSTNDVHDLRLLYGSCGITGWSLSGLTVRDVQLIHLNYPMYLVNVASCNTRNVLIQDAPVVAFEAASTTNRIEHLTLHTAAALGQNDGLSQLTLTNSLLVGVTSLGSIPYSTNSVVILGTNAAVFQIVGAGSHYLTNSSPYRDVGTTNINAGLLAELKQKTTYPPTVYSNTTISTSTTFGPLVQRDTDIPDLGYHYDPLDYCFGGVRPATNLTFTAGTAVGWFEVSGTTPPGSGLALANDTITAFNGLATIPCIFARYDTVQEGGNGKWTTKGSEGAINTQGPPDTSHTPSVNARFTKFYGLAYDRNNVQDYYQHIGFSAWDCEFWSAMQYGYGVRLNATNSLFVRLLLGNQCDCTPSVALRNCTVIGGNLTISHWSSSTWPVWIQNCVFDGTTISMDNYAGGNTNITYCDYNAFLYGSNRLAILGTHDVIVTNSFNWQSSYLGDYYLPTNSPVIDKGNTTADLIGLYHFTTQTNQDKETTTTADMGYHYVAVDSNGNPLDSDYPAPDGIPDYLEDANGNGIFDGQETDWQSPIDFGLGIYIARPRDGSLIP